MTDHDIQQDHVQALRAAEVAEPLPYQPAAKLRGFSREQLVEQYHLFCVHNRISIMSVHVADHSGAIQAAADARIAWLTALEAAWDAEEDVPVVEAFEDVLRQEADQAGARAEAAHGGQ